MRFAAKRGLQCPPNRVPFISNKLSKRVVREFTGKSPQSCSGEAKKPLGCLWSWGKVTLDCGADSTFSRSCGPGALVGLPSALTLNDYRMTATVTEDADLSFWTPRRLHSLLRERPDICRMLMAILKERIAEYHAMETRWPNQVDHSNPVGDRV